MWTAKRMESASHSKASHSKEKRLIRHHSPGKNHKSDDQDLFNVKYPKTGIGSNVRKMRGKLIAT
jgi:hypothetical protein